MHRLLLLVSLCGALSLQAQQPDAREIVKRSAALDKSNSERARNYTWTQTTLEKTLDGSGKVEKTESKTEEILVVGGQSYRRLVARNGKPISEADQKKEDERQKKTAAERAKISEADKAKRRDRDQQFREEISQAYNFSFLPDQVVDGRPVWVIAATPRPGFQSKVPRGNLLSKFQGKLWIDKTDYFWVKVECDSIENVSFGLFLAKLNKGAHIEFEQTRINNEVWLPKYVTVQIDARLLAARKRLRIEQTNSNFKKFQVDSTIRTIAEK